MINLDIMSSTGTKLYSIKKDPSSPSYTKQNSENLKSDNFSKSNCSFSDYDLKILNNLEEKTNTIFKFSGFLEFNFEPESYILKSLKDNYDCFFYRYYNYQKNSKKTGIISIVFLKYIPLSGHFDIVNRNLKYFSNPNKKSTENEELHVLNDYVVNPIKNYNSFYEKVLSSSMNQNQHSGIKKELINLFKKKFGKISIISNPPRILFNGKKAEIEFHSLLVGPDKCVPTIGSSSSPEKHH